MLDSPSSPSSPWQLEMRKLVAFFVAAASSHVFGPEVEFNSSLDPQISSVANKPRMSAITGKAFHNTSSDVLFCFPLPQHHQKGKRRTSQSCIRRTAAAGKATKFVGAYGRPLPPALGLTSLSHQLVSSLSSVVGRAGHPIGQPSIASHKLPHHVLSHSAAGVFPRFSLLR
jgi:hypothetical protein